MMHPFMLWRLHREDTGEQERVKAYVDQFLKNHLSASYRLHFFSNQSFALLIAELEVENKPYNSFFTLEQTTFCALSDCPNLPLHGWNKVARELLSAPREHVNSTSIGSLFALSRRDEFIIQSDGLGSSSAGLYEQGEIWAITNKAEFIKPLGAQLSANWDEIIIRCGLNLFTSEATGIENFRFLKRGERICAKSSGEIENSSFDPLEDWLTCPDLSSEMALKHYRETIEDQLDALSDGSKQALSLELTGGWDSRALASVMKRLEIKFAAITYGKFYCPDVILAKSVAAKLDIAIQTDSESDYGSIELYLDSVQKSNIWCQGHLESFGQKIMFNDRKLRMPRASVGGLGAEISRGFTQRSFDFSSDQAFTSDFSNYLMSKVPRFYTSSMRQRCLERAQEVAQFSLRWQKPQVRLTGLMLLLNRRRERIFNGHIQHNQFTPFYDPALIPLGLASGFNGKRPVDFFPKSLIRERELLKLPHSKFHFVNQLYWNLRKDDLKFYDKRYVWQRFGRERLIDATKSNPSSAFLDQESFKSVMLNPDAYAAFSFADRVCSS